MGSHVGIGCFCDKESSLEDPVDAVDGMRYRKKSVISTGFSLVG